MSRPTDPVTGPASDEQLARRLRDAWPMMTWGPLAGTPRTIVVMHSIAVHLPPRWQPLMPAYEERFLCFLLSLTSPHTRIVYVTSMPILPRLIDYWLGLVPGLDTPETRRRLVLVPVVDARAVPLARKVLDHPGVMRRIRDAVADPALSVLMSHMVTEDELAVARCIGVPAYGPAPKFAHWGTKSGSRQAFEAVDVACPPAVAGVRTPEDVEEAIAALRDGDPRLGRVVVKLDEGASGTGNGTVALTPGRSVAECLAGIEFEEPAMDAGQYFERLRVEGGVVEAFVTGEEVRSPSAQVRITPGGEAQVTSTHEQILGGPNRLTYVGCRMPAEPEYAATIAAMASRVGGFLAREGVVGRLAIDFLAVRSGQEWAAYGLEINLRHGGTTHPMAALAALTGGGYDVATSAFLTDRGEPRCYLATDHLERPAYARLTTDDLLDLLPRHDLGWDHEARTGVIVHMPSAIGGMGVLGLTAVGETPAAAESLFARAQAVVDAEAREIG